MRGESDRLATLISVPAKQGPPKEQPPGNSQVKELSHVSNLESGTAVPTDGDNRQQAGAPAGDRQPNKYWPPVGRVDNAFGDRNLICACPPLNSWEDAAE